MLLFKAENIYDVAKPLHISSQLIGLTSFSIVKTEGIFLGTAKWYNILGVMSFSSSSLIFAFLFIDNMTKVWAFKTISISKLYENSLFCVILSYIGSTILINLWTFATRKYFARALNLLEEVDVKLEAINAPVNLTRHKKVLLMFIIITKFLAFLCICLAKLIGKTTDLFRLNYLFMIPLFLCIETTVLFVFQFTFWMWAVKLRYRKINLFLRDYFLETRMKISRADGDEILNKIAIIHDKLVDVSEHLNRCYGVPVRLSQSDSDLITQMEYFLKRSSW